MNTTAGKTKAIKMKTVISLCLALLVGLVMTTSQPAQADTASDASEFSVQSGTLQFEAAPNVPDFPSTVLTGQLLSANTAMNNWAVRDATGTAAGWRVTAQGDSTAGKSPVLADYNIATSSYASGGASFAPNSISLSNSGTFISGIGTSPTQACAAGCSLDSSSASTVASAATGAGLGLWQFTYANNNLALAIPTTTKALAANHLYRVDLVWTLSSGP